MKLIVATCLLAYSFTTFCANPAPIAKKMKNNLAKHDKVETVPSKATAPCDSKDDLLKKLEEKKKAAAASEKPKAFSLQGGDTGCSVK